MHMRVLGLTASAIILACGTVAAIAQDQSAPQSDQQQTQSRPMSQGDEGTTGQGRMTQGAMPGRGMMERGMMERGMMGGGMMGHGMMAGGAAGGCSPIMSRIIFALMDADGDGTISLQEFEAAHERIFKAMDANRDGQLTEDEMSAFMHGVTRSAPQQ
jgi:hypothetical protein